MSQVERQHLLKGTLLRPKAIKAPKNDRGLPSYYKAIGSSSLKTQILPAMTLALVEKKPSSKNTMKVIFKT